MRLVECWHWSWCSVLGDLCMWLFQVGAVLFSRKRFLSPALFCICCVSSVCADQPYWHDPWLLLFRINSSLYEITCFVVQLICCCPCILTTGNTLGAVRTGCNGPCSLPFTLIVWCTKWVVALTTYCIQNSSHRCYHNPNTTIVLCNARQSDVYMMSTSMSWLWNIVHWVQSVKQIQAIQPLTSYSTPGSK